LVSKQPLWAAAAATDHDSLELMGRIRILPDAIANKIAAGEVVERPASVVKELLENSLDAGATEIRVEAEHGGRRLLRIADNGHGMLRDDALLAFERHATSKLRSAEDLFSIATLGFRGEALPSIASVSRLELETRSAEETTGTRIEIAGAKLLRCDEFARDTGTTITIRDLFYNVPARRKFLRTEQTELAHIASLVTHYSLAHQDKTFELLHNGSRLLFVTPVSMLRERVFQVFGSEILGDLVEVPDTAREGFRLNGFVSHPQIQKLNRNSIYLFVNGRLIKDKVLLHALTGAYHNLMPPGCFPFALLFLDTAPEEVDVNVHPSKTEVRFQRGSFVHDFVRDSIRNLLLAQRPASSLPLPAPAQPAAALPYSEFSAMVEQGTVSATPHPALSPAGGPALDPRQVRLVMPDARDEAAPILTLPRASSPMPQPAAQPPAPGEDAPVTTPGSIRLPMPDTHMALPAGAWADAAPSLDELRDLRPLGQLQDSFIIAAGRDGLWIIDQHVAHERILFEQVLARMATGQVERQQLLLPMVIPLTVGQQIEFARIARELQLAGFDAEPFGHRTLAVKSAPAGLGAGEVERVIQEILEIAENELRRASVDDIRRGVAASVACRAAIKINMPLDRTKMEWLLRELANCQFPSSCPHGRPIALRYPMRDILRGFHRI
jgi:DNA mismatch repair protein MutL